MAVSVEDTEMSFSCLFL